MNGVYHTIQDCDCTRWRKKSPFLFRYVEIHRVWVWKFGLCMIVGTSGSDELKCNQYFRIEVCTFQKYINCTKRFCQKHILPSAKSLWRLVCWEHFPTSHPWQLQSWALEEDALQEEPCHGQKHHSLGIGKFLFLCFSVLAEEPVLQQAGPWQWSKTHLACHPQRWRMPAA